MIVAPTLLEVKRLLERKISVFSGSDFTVDSSVGLNGVCDFLVSRSPEQFEIEAPVLVLVEAKRDNLNVSKDAGRLFVNVQLPVTARLWIDFKED